MKRKMLHQQLVYNKCLKKDNMHYTYKLVLELVGEDKDVLEVGCHTGYFTELLQNNRCKIVGIEIDPKAASKAKQFAKKVLVGDIEDENLLSQIDQRFDVILFMDVLEHLVDPWEILKSTKALLKRNGFVIITIPNVACWSIRKALFFKGKFTYIDTGILDITHLRFFTFTSAQKLILNSGYRIEHCCIVEWRGPFARSLSKIPLLRKLAYLWRSFLGTLFPNLCGGIFLFKAKDDRESE